MQFLYGSLPILMAPTGGAEGGGGPASILPTLVTFGLVFLIFYFLIIRPQNKKQKETKKMLASLKKGDRVVSIGGVHGTITSIKDDTVVMKIDSNTKMTFSRSAISNVVEQSRPSKKAEPVEDETDEAEEETQTDADED